MAGATALALATGAIVWAATHGGDARSASVDATGASTAEDPLPTPSVDATPSLPSPDAAIDEVQPLAPVRPDHVAPLADAATIDPAASGSLDLTLLQPCGAPARSLDFSAEPPKFELRADGVFPFFDDRKGQLLLAGLPVETPIQLWFTDSVDYEVFRLELTLAPGEQRVLSETISRDLRCVIVRVRDGAGRPIDGARVHLVAAVTEGEARSIKSVDRWSGQVPPRDRPPDHDRGSRWLSDAEVAERNSWEHGVVRFDALAAESVSVCVSREGYGMTWISDVPLDHDPLELTVTLEPGFRVDVEVVDEAGQPRDVDEVELRGTPVSVLAVRTAPGHYRFADFPEQATGITANVQARCWSIDHDAHQPLARMVVPASGSIEVTWSDLEPHCRPMGISIQSDSANWGWFEAMDATTRAAHGPVIFEDVAPGDYRVELHCPDGTGADRTATVTVRPGQRSEVRLVP